MCVCVCVFSHVRLFVTLSPAPPTLHPGLQPARLLSGRGILQARILEWVAIPYSRGSSPPRDQTRVSCTDRQVLHHHTTWSPLLFSQCQGARECQDGAETWHLGERRRVILCQIPEAHWDHILTRLFTNGEHRHKVVSFLLNTLYLFILSCCQL